MTTPESEQFVTVVPVVETGDGQVIDGACVSLIVTVNMHEAGLPAASLTLQVIVVVPTTKKEPAGGVQVVDPTPWQLSVTIGAA